MTIATGSGDAAAAAAAEPRAAAASPSADAAPAAAAAPDFWSLLVSARTSEQLCRAWLGILCQWVPGVQAGVLLLHDEGERYAPAAVWPDPGRDMSFLAGAAQQALADRRGVVRTDDAGLSQCAYPLLAADRPYGVVVLHVAARGSAPLRDALRLLHWGAGWLVGLFDKKGLLERDARLQRSALLQDLLLGLLADRGDAEAPRWVVNHLVQSLPCRQALLGRADGDAAEVTLLAVSGSASFDPRSNLLAAAREAMLDAVLSGQAEQQPAPGRAEDAPRLAVSPLADYVQESRAGSALVLPLVHGGERVGALLLDFDRPPADEVLDFARTLALALAPALHLHQAASRSLWRHLRDSSGAALRALAGPRRPGLRVALLGTALLLAGAAFWPVPYRVGAPATVEGRVQRAAVAPFAGFIQESAVRAGDRVKAGDLLARLDDRELKLEQARWAAQAEVAERKVRDALARGAAVAVQLARAESDEAQAQLALVESRLARAAVTAPFDGVVVRGDLTQQLGAPVEQGKVLFEVAPLDAWRVVLQVDERDILAVRAGADGELVLGGLPGERFRFTVAKVSPVAVAEEGRNAFRVEAAVQGAPALIQPGMRGVGKVTAGERSLLWIAGHRLFDWVRYTAWQIGL